VIREKKQTINELRTLNFDLEKKANGLQKLRADLEGSRVYVSSLGEAIPKSPKVEDYLVDLVTAVGSVGYRQNYFLPVPSESGTLGIRVRYQGSPSQFLSLIKAIEEMPRLTTINEITYSYTEEAAQVNMYLEIYHLANKQ
jgi:Tfp pilus assembly protein PilO